jgi:hypothetical protein
MIGWYVKTLTAGKVTRKAENGKGQRFARLSWAAGDGFLLRHDRHEKAPALALKTDLASGAKLPQRRQVIGSCSSNVLKYADFKALNWPKH